MKNKNTTPVAAGVIIGLVLIVLGLIFYFSGVYLKEWARYPSPIILIAGIIWAVINYSKEQDHFKTFGELFTYGFKATAVITCLMIAYGLLTTYIFPDIKVQLIETQRAMALQKPGANEEMIDKGMEMFSKYYLTFLIGGTIFSTLLIGVVASLIGAGVSKKIKKTEFDQIS